MVHRFNWKAGILFGIAFAVVCMVFYVFVGANVDFVCKNTSPNAFGCGLYRAVDVGMTVYANFFLQFIAKECVGGGPDSCIGPALSIMLFTLLVAGFILGGFIFRRKVVRK